VSSSNYTISSNTLTNCTASSLTSGSSHGANAYGGGISVAIGAYSGAELVVTAYSSLGLCICVSADGGMSPNSCFFHLLEGMDWGADCHQWNKDARHNNPVSWQEARKIGLGDNPVLRPGLLSSWKVTCHIKSSRRAPRL
jgi:hypothetical protein